MNYFYNSNSLSLLRPAQHFVKVFGQMEMSFSVKVGTIDVIVDSGTRSHVVISSDFIEPGTWYLDNTTVQVVGGGTMKLKGRGLVKLVGMGPKPVELKDCLVIPGGGTNLLSMSRFDKAGYLIVVEDGKMSFINKSTNEIEISAQLWGDGLYHVVKTESSFSTSSIIKAWRTYPNKPSDNAEVPREVLESLARLLRILGVLMGENGKPIRIWDPFVDQGLSKTVWESLGCLVVGHNPGDNYFDPKGPVCGDDYDWLITCAPFSKSVSFLARLSFEPKFIILTMLDSVARKYWNL